MINMNKPKKIQMKVLLFVSQANRYFERKRVDNSGHQNNKRIRINPEIKTILKKKINCNQSGKLFSFI